MKELIQLCQKVIFLVLPFFQLGEWPSWSFSGTKGRNRNTCICGFSFLCTGTPVPSATGTHLNTCFEGGDVTESKRLSCWECSNAPRQGLNTDRSIERQAHWPWVHCASQNVFDLQGLTACCSNHPISCNPGLVSLVIVFLYYKRKSKKKKLTN